jgi:glycerol dehydrogenase
LEKIFGAPQRYIQGAGAIGRLGEYVGYLGNRFFLFGDEIVLSLVRAKLSAGLILRQKDAFFESFGGESTKDEIDRLSERCQALKCDAVAGAGGGKAADTAKAIGLNLRIPIVILPTIASTDAPTSRLIAIYNDDHNLVEVLRMDKNPDAVVVDTEIIAQAPSRFLVAGMGDALSTKFEAEMCALTHAKNFFNGENSQSALILAQSCYDVIRQYGLEAKRSVEEKKVTDALEKVVEANIFMSGIGFESGGLAAAHAIHAGFTLIPEMANSFHGEKVAFGLLVQFVMEKRGNPFIEDMLEFYRSLGLPSTLEALGVKEITSQKLKRIAQRACMPNTYMHNMSMPVGEEMVIKAIIEADSLSHLYAKRHPS